VQFWQFPQKKAVEFVAKCSRERRQARLPTEPPTVAHGNLRFCGNVETWI